MPKYVLTPHPPKVNAVATYTTFHTCRLLGPKGHPLTRMSLWRFAKAGLIKPQKPRVNKSLFSGDEIMRCWSKWWEEKIG